MSQSVLALNSVSVGVDGTSILQGVDLSVRASEVHVLFGENGSGKSSLLSTIMGLPPYALLGGTITYKGKDISALSVDARAALGIGMAFQRPPSLEGVTVAQLAGALGAKETLAREAEALDMRAFGERNVGVGFSGGEIKRWEVLKLFLQAPDLILVDEPESGVDLAHVAAVGRAVNRLVSEPARDGSGRSALVITHTGLILEHIAADHGHIMSGGKIIYSGEPTALFRHIQTSGYGAPAP